MCSRKASHIHNRPVLTGLFIFSPRTHMNLNQHSAGAPAHQQVATEGDLPEVNDRYAKTILSFCTHMYDAIEVHGVRDKLAGSGVDGTDFEIDNENPELFSVYVHAIEGGVDPVGDHSTYALAAEYARELSAEYQWAVRDFVPNKHRGLKTLQ